MPNTIRCYADADGQYYADFTDDDGAAEMLRLLGTTQVPMPYCRPYPIVRAAAELQRRNPDAIILITSGPTT